MSNNQNAIITTFKKPLVQSILLALSLSLSGCGGSDSNPPTVDAGNDQSLNEHTKVTLTGSANDSDGVIINFQWQQISGTGVTLHSPNSSTTTFSAPEIVSDETLVLALTATDDDGNTSTDTVNINVANVNQLPSANAGIDQTVNETSTFTITGSGSDSDGQIVSYAWQQESGAAVNPDSVNNNSLTFTAPSVTTAELLTFSLTVTDNDGASATDTVNITVVNVNQIPVVEAGEAQQVDEQTLVTLNGSATDADGSIIDYHWQQTSGINIELYMSDQAQIEFLAPAIASDQTLTFELTATDNEGATATDEVEITVVAVQGLINDVVFEDSQLRDCVRNKAQQLSIINVEELTSLSCIFNRLESLAGIEAFTSLTELALSDEGPLSSDGPLSDLTPLASLTELTKLHLSFDKLEDILPVANLTKLTDLRLAYGKITDITPLANLENLTVLDLDENLALRDISVLAELTSLTYLTLAYNNINDISSLSDLTQLTLLNLTGNQVAEASALTNLTNIEFIGLGYNLPLSDISGILNLPNITDVFLLGSTNIPCTQIDTLKTNFTDATLFLPASCIED